MKLRRNSGDEPTSEMLVRRERGRLIIELPDEGSADPHWLNQAREDLEGRSKAVDDLHLISRRPG